jgi:hypothetical protein
MEVNKTSLMFIVLMIICVGLCITTIYYQTMYNIAVKESAKDIVTALEMVTACKILSNVTDEQIFNEVMKWYMDK